ncbi:hypothetical protein GOZ80_10815 [Agrobacterium vitis]|uniref:Uncharacterized protein n=3 Tax=Agrobacterium vitis TaxID=373 RepID=A0A7K1RFA0_AGRVI|nr:hypothetical protein [Agrobacterium vitis]MUO80888.1 hypothetical protein [Agrobacterium vitis]MUO94796.1 hypothetical protein [Agrobacterium vitis]MUP05442.1 hypothetical protein [Agrobacterium vitis]MUZ81564.1 hypothetical protein [Agrobacterium vitis]MVA56688.1 hypothetical protein [Agrobacterium vitis]
MDDQLAKLVQKVAELAELTDYLRAKRDWVTRGNPGDEPRFTDETLCLASTWTGLRQCVGYRPYLHSIAQDSAP